MLATSMRVRALAVVLVLWAVLAQPASGRTSGLTARAGTLQIGSTVTWSPRWLIWAEDLLVTYGFFV